VFETKLRAIGCHTSQIKDPEGLVKRMTDRHRALDQFGREVMREEFHVITLA
jgi:hypothetical protein